MSDPPKPECLSRVAGRRPVVEVLAAALGAPRARCAAMVRRGRVAASGRVIRDLHTRVDPFRDQVTLDGAPLPLDNACRYLLLNKPYGVLSAFTAADDERPATDPEQGTDEGSDPTFQLSNGPRLRPLAEGRKTLAGYVDVPGVYPAGRLDLDSEGLVLLTDDGWLIHRLSHPRYHHPKTYLVQVEGVPGPEALEALRRGVPVKGKPTAPALVDLLPGEPGPAEIGSSGAGLPERPLPIRYRKTVPTAWLRVVLTEGRKRQVRHMTAAVGHPTLRLVRVGIGPLVLGDLQPGEWRALESGELEALRAALHEAPLPAGRPGPSAPPPGRGAPSGRGREGGARSRGGGARPGRRPRRPAR